ncbi:hypothetical protein BU15DRAFT_78894 [Melanogaster broomeanus]|nr:hypothetical protein BU15DRAFT_78894 [Melanogaster broomeanus]
MDGPGIIDGINLNTLIGPIEIGAYMATLFLGCAFVQAHVYYENFQKDHWAIKTLVGAELVLQTAHVVSMCVAAYTMTITNYGQPQTLIVLPRSSDVTVVLGPFIAFGVQSFFTYRLYRLSNSLPLPVFCFALAITRLILVFLVGIAGFAMTDVTSYEHTWGGAITALLVISTLSFDVKLPWMHLVYPPVHSTSLQVNKIIVWTIETGLVTGLTEVVQLICFLTVQNYIWMGIYSIATGIYLNSLLTALNGRKRLRKGSPDVHKFSSVENTTTRSSQAIRIDVSRLGVSDSPLRDNRDEELHKVEAEYV